MELKIREGESFVLHLDNLAENAKPLQMAWIKPGTFVMGCPEMDRYYIPDVNHQFTVILTHGYWLGVYPVTQAHWRSVMHTMPDDIPLGANKPVVNVNWNEAITFCDSLNQITEEFLPDQYRFRLPLEAEWEYAYKGLDYSRSEVVLDEIAWHLGNASGLMDVGLKKSNSFGLYDMQGNIREWCYDEAGYFRPTETTTNYVGKYREEARHVRSGAYASPISEFFFLDCVGDAFRKTTKRKWLGFRLCLGHQIPFD